MKSKETQKYNTKDDKSIAYILGLCVFNLVLTLICACCLLFLMNIQTNDKCAKCIKQPEMVKVCSCENCKCNNCKCDFTSCKKINNSKDNIIENKTPQPQKTLKELNPQNFIYPQMNTIINDIYAQDKRVSLVKPTKYILANNWYVEFEAIYLYDNGEEGEIQRNIIIYAKENNKWHLTDKILKEGFAYGKPEREKLLKELNIKSK